MQARLAAQHGYIGKSFSAMSIFHLSSLTFEIEFLKYAHTLGCTWNFELSICAAIGGELECLKYLHESGCTRNAIVCTKAGNFIFQSFEPLFSNYLFQPCMETWSV
jgi:hypothetical protein